MLTIKPKRSIAALAVAAGLLAAAGPAGAILYNGHAGLGASTYQHNQTDLELAAVSDGTSNTVQFAEATHREAIALDRGFTLMG